MAERIIEQWRLPVLRIELDLDAPEPMVVATLSSYLDDVSASRIWKIQLPPAEFGIEGSAPHALLVPARLRGAVADATRRELSSEDALWLHLVPPYGFLGAVPWELALASDIDLPVLRVPNKLPVTPTLGSVWTVAIAVDAAPQSSWAPDYLRDLVHELVAVPPDVSVDIFADASTATALRRLTLPHGTRVHDPSEAKPVSARRAADILTWIDPAMTPPVARVWADWIANGLKGRAVQLLVLLADGGFDGAQPVLLVSADPQRPAARSKATYVPTTDIVRFADMVGAATICFGSPPHGRDDVAVRMLADLIGQQRAGPTLYSSLALDGSGRSLVRAAAYLRAPSGTVIPHDASLFAYLQPDYIRSDTPASTITDPYRSAQTVPSWVVSADRYLTDQRVALDRSAASPIPTAPARTAYETGVAKAVEQLTEIITRHASDS